MSVDEVLDLCVMADGMSMDGVHDLCVAMDGMSMDEILDLCVKMATEKYLYMSIHSNNHYNSYIRLKNRFLTTTDTYTVRKMFSQGQLYNILHENLKLKGYSDRYHIRVACEEVANFALCIYKKENGQPRGWNYE
jgi:hypothetical protein